MCSIIIVVFSVVIGNKILYIVIVVKHRGVKGNIMEWTHLFLQYCAYNIYGWFASIQPWKHSVLLLIMMTTLKLNTCL